MNCSNNVITLNMPVTKENSQILRLTAAGAFNQAGFALDVIEDAKVIVSEVLNCLLNGETVAFTTSFTIENLKVIMAFETCDQKDVLIGANEFSLPIIEALADEVQTDESGRLIIAVAAV